MTNSRLHTNAAGPKYTVTCPNCKTKQEVYDRSFYGVGKKCKKCWMVFGPGDLLSSDCNNWNHVDCYNSKGKCNCKCHKPGTDQYIKYEKRRKEKRNQKKK